jgi:hypothetical protein
LNVPKVKGYGQDLKKEGIFIAALLLCFLP